MLDGATAAPAEILAGRLDPRRGGLDYFDEIAELVLPPALAGLEPDTLARKGSGNEHRPIPEFRDPASVVAEIDDTRDFACVTSRHEEQPS